MISLLIFLSHYIIYNRYILLLFFI